MEAPHWIFAACGLLGLWVALSAVLSLRSGIARRRDGKLLLRSEQPDAFLRAVVLDLVGGAIFVAVAVAVIFFRLSLRSVRFRRIADIRNWISFGPMRGAVAFVLVSATTYAAGLSTIERILIPAGQGQPAYRLEVEGLADHQFDDSRRLAITAGGQRKIVSVEGGLVAARDSIGPALLARNALRSKFVFTARPMPDDMIIVFGYAFASDPGAMRVIRLGVRPEQVLSEETFVLTDVRKGADAHSLLLIGKRSLSQMGSKCVSTYDPYSVFKLSDPTKGRFQYSLALSEKYNLAHYAGWAGPNAREDIGVNICQKPARMVRL